MLLPQQRDVHCTLLRNWNVTRVLVALKYAKLWRLIYNVFKTQYFYMSLSSVFEKG
jgi:hypothetical protein